MDSHGPCWFDLLFHLWHKPRKSLSNVLASHNFSCWADRHHLAAAPCSQIAHTVQGVSNPGQGGLGSEMAVKAFLDPVILVCRLFRKPWLEESLSFWPSEPWRFIVKVKALFVSVWPYRTWVESDDTGILPQENSSNVCQTDSSDL